MKDIGLRGTTSRDRINKFPIQRDNQFGKNTRGHMVIQWNDNSPVIVLSNFDSMNPVKTASSWDKTNKQKIDIPLPQLVKNYDQHMWGVDLHTVILCPEFFF